LIHNLIKITTDGYDIMAKKRSKKKSTTVPMKAARDFEKSRSLKARKIDECKRNENMLPKPTQEWMLNPDKSDVLGIDEPHTKKLKGYSRAKKGDKGGEKVIPVKSHFRGKKPGANCAKKS